MEDPIRNDHQARLGHTLRRLKVSVISSNSVRRLPRSEAVSRVRAEVCERACRQRPRTRCAPTSTLAGAERSCQVCDGPAWPPPLPMPLFMNLVAAGLPQPSPTPADPEATMPVKESGDGRATRLRRRLSRPLTGGNKTKTTTAVSTLLAEANTQEAGQAGVLKRSDSMANSRTRTNLQKRPAPTQEPAPTSTASSPLPTVGVPSRPPPVMRLASAPPVPANYRRSPPASPTKSLQLVGAAPMVRRRSSGGYSSASPLPTLQSLPPVATPVRFPTAEEDYFSSSPPSSSSSGLRFSTSLDRPSPGSYLSASRLGNDVQEQDEAADEMGDLPSLRISTSPTATSLPDNSPATIARERAAALARLEAASSTSQAGSVSSYGNNSLEVTPRPSSSSLQTETGRPDAPATAGRPIGGLSLASPDLAGSPPSSDPGPIHFPLKSAWRSPARGSGQFNPPAFAHGESSESLVHPPFSPSMSPRRPYPMRRSSFSSTSPGGGMQTASVSALSLNLGSDPYSASRTSLQLDTVQELEPSTSAVSHPSSPPRPRRSRSRTGQTTVRPPAVRRGSTSSPVRMGEYTPPPTIGDEEVIRFALAFLKRELGAGKMRRRPASMYVDPNVHADLSDEEREFWGALQDGVLLCKCVCHDLLTPSPALTSSVGSSIRFTRMRSQVSSGATRRMLVRPTWRPFSKRRGTRPTSTKKPCSPRPISCGATRPA